MGSEMSQKSFEVTVSRAVEMREGAGARVKRCFPTQRQRSVDPFVLLDDFSVPRGAGFPEHPHGGFEMVTYMLEGGLKHEDSTGTERVVSEGEAQRITTGRGVRHSEMPVTGRENRGLQLWVNLPRRLKDVAPSYGSASAEELPFEKFEMSRIVTVVGEGSPVELRTPVDYRFVELERSGGFDWSVPPGWSGLVYCVDGEVELDGKEVRAGDLAVVSGEGDVAVGLRGMKKSRFAVLSGEPIGEDIRLRGSFVE